LVKLKTFFENFGEVHDVTLARAYDGVLGKYVDQRNMIKRIKKARTHKLKQLLKNDPNTTYDKSYDTFKITKFRHYLDKLVEKIRKKTKKTIN